MRSTSLQTNIVRGLRILLVLGVIALFFGPLYLDLGHLRFFTEVFSLLVLAMMWNLVAGYADIVTVGQHAFVGIGGYAFYAFAAKTDLNVAEAFIAAGLLSLLIGIPITAVVFRMRAAYLAIGTWVVAEAFRLGIAQSA